MQGRTLSFQHMFSQPRTGRSKVDYSMLKRGSGMGLRIRGCRMGAERVRHVKMSGTAQRAEKQYPGIQTAPRPKKLDWNETIVVQAFEWPSSQKDGRWYDLVREQIPTFVELHATHVWLPPPSHSVSPEGYLPTQYYDLSSKYGDFDSLTKLNACLLEANLRPVADIVINHRCADAQDENGVWNTFRDDIDHPGSRIDWGPWAITCNDPDFNGSGSRDTGSDYGPSPDLDHSNPIVQQGIIDWLSWLRSYIGFEGWRLDFVKGYDGKTARNYIENTLEPGVDFCVGEFWVDAAWDGAFLEYNQNKMRQDLCDWIDEVKYSAAFDFTTKALLQEAVRNCEYDRMMDNDGKPSGLLGWWPSHAVTFIDNHDTGSSQQHWPFPDEGILQGYAYILTHPGIPCIFWNHLTDPEMIGALKDLAALRKRSGINSVSKIEILTAEKDMYVAKVNDNVICKLGPRFDMGELTPDVSWTVCASGKDWAVFEKTNQQ